MKGLRRALRVRVMGRIINKDIRERCGTVCESWGNNGLVIWRDLTL